MTSYLDLQTGYQAYDTDEDAPDQHLLTDEEAPVHVHSNGHSDTGEHPGVLLSRVGKAPFFCIRFFNTDTLF